MDRKRASDGGGEPPEKRARFSVPRHWIASSIAFLCGQHTRCGAASPLRILPSYAMRDILSYFDGTITELSEPGSRLRYAVRCRLIFPVMVAKLVVRPCRVDDIIEDGLVAPRPIPVMVIGDGVVYWIEQKTGDMVARMLFCREWHLRVHLECGQFCGMMERVALFEDSDTVKPAAAVWSRLLLADGTVSEMLAPDVSDAAGALAVALREMIRAGYLEVHCKVGDVIPCVMSSLYKKFTS